MLMEMASNSNEAQLLTLYFVTSAKTSFVAKCSGVLCRDYKCILKKTFRGGISKRGLMCLMTIHNSTTQYTMTTPLIKTVKIFAMVIKVCNL